MSRTRGPLAAIVLAIAFAACSSASGQLQAGMTPDQTVTAMGSQPDLKDNVANPSGHGDVLRYIWLKPGKAAVFDASNHVAKVEDVQPDQVAALGPPPEKHFDPIATPLDYAFYPLKASFFWIGAGLTCIAGGGCHKPNIPSPGSNA